MHKHVLALLVLLAGQVLRAEAPASGPAGTLHLDLEQRTAPINPFIYGQFIEHMGRCIYGGIWAEMLEDRKFYYPIAADYAPYRELKDSAYPVVGASPWQILGSAPTLQMNTREVFVGEHSPQLTPEAGLRQRDLGLIAGKSYTGYLWAKATGTEIVRLSLTLKAGPDEAAGVSQTLSIRPGGYSKYEYSFTAPASTDHGSLELRLQTGALLLGTISLMPADNVHGMRRDTLALLKQLNSPIYRWPGGNFTSGYDWRDGIGDRDRRPPRGNPAWTGVEHNDFGTDEFLLFCRELGTTPMIAANTGFGDAYSAAQWVEYCNGKTDTLAGGWRARNGHPAPYGVRYWCVGNEMFGPWQLGFMQLHHYTLKHNQVAKAMRRIDPSLVLSGVGAIDTINKDNDPAQAKSGLTWSEGMLTQCAEQMDLISEHGYEGRLPWKTPAETPKLTLTEHIALLPKLIRHIADKHRETQARLPNLKGRVVPIAFDEWNYWHREYMYGELGCSYDLADGLGVAAGLHEFFRQSDLIHMAHYAQTVNVIGAIKTSKTEAEMESTGLVLQLYRAHFGTQPLKLSQDFAPLDVSAALSKDGRTLSIAIINPTQNSLRVPLKLSHGELAGSATRWSLCGPTPESANAPGKPRLIDIATTTGIDASQALEAPAQTCVLYSLPLK